MNPFAPYSFAVVDRAATKAGPHALQLLRLEGGLIQRLVLLLLRWRLGRIEPLHLASAGDNVEQFVRRGQRVDGDAHRGARRGEQPLVLAWVHADVVAFFRDLSQ